jgi:hypothetical protein
LFLQSASCALALNSYAVSLDNRWWFFLFLYRTLCRKEKGKFDSGIWIQKWLFLQRFHFPLWCILINFFSIIFFKTFLVQGPSFSFSYFYLIHMSWLCLKIVMMLLACNGFVICDFLFKFYWLSFLFQSGDAKIKFQCGTWCCQCNLVGEWCSLAVNKNWWTAIAYSYLW